MFLSLLQSRDYFAIVVSASFYGEFFTAYFRTDEGLCLVHYSVNK